VDVVFVIIVSIICFLICVLLVLSLFFVRSVKKARATRGTYSPSAQEMFGNSAIEILKPPPAERLI
jgi:flagellar basal body-associated protein FliL